MGTIVLVLFSAIVGICLGIGLGMYTVYNQMQDSFDDAMDKANLMFLNSVDKITKSYETLYADFKKCDLPLSTDKEGK